MPNIRGRSVRDNDVDKGEAHEGTATINSAMLTMMDAVARLTEHALNTLSREPVE